MANTVRIQLRIPKPLAKRLRQVVRESGQSRNSMVTHAIWSTVDTFERRIQFLAWQKAERERQEAEDHVLSRNKGRGWRLKRQRMRRIEDEREVAKNRLHLLLLEGLRSGPGRPIDEVIAEMQKLVDKELKGAKPSQGRTKRQNVRSK